MLPGPCFRPNSRSRQTDQYARAYAAVLSERGQCECGSPLQSIAAEGEAINVSGLNLSGSVTTFTGIVESVEITQDAARERRFLVTINEVGGT